MINSQKIIFSTAYFPPVQYFSKVVKISELYIEKYENFIKQTYRNRCTILSANGIQSLSIPIIKENKPKTLIKDTRIEYVTNWQKIHFKSIESAYKNSPFYDFLIDDLIIYFEKKYNFLFDYNFEIFNTILQIIDIEIDIKFNEAFILIDDSDYEDLRYKFTPKKDFDSDNNFNILQYNQVFSEKYKFVPDLSILDVIFNLGGETKTYLEKCYKN